MTNALKKVIIDYREGVILDCRFREISLRRRTIIRDLKVLVIAPSSMLFSAAKRESLSSLLVRGDSSEWGHSCIQGLRFSPIGIEHLEAGLVCYKSFPPMWHSL